MSSVDAIVARVGTSRRYRDVDVALVRRLATEELPRARNADDATKRVKRRLHQAVGAFARGGASLDAVRDAWRGDMGDASFREACARVMAGHASTAERVAHLDAFFGPVWAAINGPPASVLDLGCGLGPLALPWMDLGRGARYVAIDIDGAALRTVDAFLDLVEQPHAVSERDLVAAPVDEPAAVALLLKLVTTLDRQDPGAAARLIRGLRVDHAVVSFTRRSLGGRSSGMERTYRRRMEGLAREVGVDDLAEASVANELVFVLRLANG